MNNIIIGTAGHVDHGKTTLVKALTGIDTDRLKEEKEHGVTIELGFAYLDLPSGEKAGIIDVPGHEKFIKNMLAGAGGIDIALMVIAADDGVMPQTREHLGILSLLGVSDGIVVITKADAVDAEWLEMVVTDVKKETRDTFLENAPVISVSARAGQGIEELKELIFRKIKVAVAKNVAKPFRIPVDRVFSVDGFGTVITGTLIEGTLATGSEAELYPANISARVRNLQIHSSDVENAYAGQRVAVNLSGVKKNNIKRGDILAAHGSMRNTMMLDVRLSLFKDSRRSLVNDSRLHFYHGSSETLCRLVLLDCDELEPGGDGYAQLRFTEEIAAKKGDRFIVRFYSPVETVGGGIILDPNPPKHRRKVKKVIDALKICEFGSTTDILLQAIADSSPDLLPLSEVQNKLHLDGETFRLELSKLIDNGRIFRITDDVVIDAGYKTVLAKTLEKILGDYHSANPLQAGMRRDELRGHLLPGRQTAIADAIIGIFEKDGTIALDGRNAALSDFKIKYGDREQRLAADIEAMFVKSAYSPINIDEIYSMYPKEKTAVKQVLDAMFANGTLIAADPRICFHRDTVSDANVRLSEFIAQNGQITLAEFRDMTGTSRKFALALLEYFDKRGITKKIGDNRMMNKR